MVGIKDFAASYATYGSIVNTDGSVSYNWCDGIIYTNGKVKTSYLYDFYMTQQNYRFEYYPNSAR